MRLLFILLLFSGVLKAQVTTTLDGSRSSDTDGTVTSYLWSQVSGPATATFSSFTAVKPTVTFTVAGDYVFLITVADNQGAKSVDDETVTANPAAGARVKITVKPANVRPKADAGPDQVIQLAFLNRNNGKVVSNLSRISVLQ